VTLILGHASGFDYGALISDVRVSWGTDQHADMLQKIYPVGPLLLAGFAGSVQVGFQMIHDMREAFALPPDHIWLPSIAVWRWWRRARRIFRYQPIELQQLGCSLIVAAVSPVRSGFIGTFSYAAVMRSPDFRPEFLKRGSWAGIGNAKTHSVATKMIESYQRDPWSYLQVEKSFLGAAAWMLGSLVMQDLVDDPHESVSEAVQLGVVSSKGIEISNLRVSVSMGASGSRNLSHGHLVTSWEEFLKYCVNNGLRAPEASA
jgi:hypothetical protein